MPRPEIQFPLRFAPVVALAVVSLLASLPVMGAESGTKPGKEPTVKLESVPGSTVKRVILTAKAAERLDIQTGKVGEEVIVPRQMVSGLVLRNPQRRETKPRAPAIEGAGPGDGELLIRISLSRAEWDRLAKDKPARILPLTVRDKPSFPSFLATPSGKTPTEDARSAMLTVSYVVPAKTDLAPDERVRVELQLASGEGRKKVVPYGSVFYDAKGGAWVYVNTAPLTFERQKIVVDNVTGNLAIVSEGPDVGAAIVTVGASLLHGAEIFGK